MEGGAIQERQATAIRGGGRSIRKRASQMAEGAMQCVVSRGSTGTVPFTNSPAAVAMVWLAYETSVLFVVELAVVEEEKGGGQ